jgi:hypothetical protein
LKEESNGQKSGNLFQGFASEVVKNNMEQRTVDQTANREGGSGKGMEHSVNIEELSDMPTLVRPLE